jgi:hypothetical protein
LKAYPVADLAAFRDLPAAAFEPCDTKRDGAGFFDGAGALYCSVNYSALTKCGHRQVMVLLTFYRISAKRSALLADVIGVIVHDHWKPYFTW